MAEKPFVKEVEIHLTLRSSERDTKDLFDITEAVKACLNTSLGFRVLLIDQKLVVHQTPDKVLSSIISIFSS